MFGLAVKVGDVVFLLVGFYVGGKIRRLLERLNVLLECRLASDVFQLVKIYVLVEFQLLVY